MQMEQDKHRADPFRYLDTGDKTGTPWVARSKTRKRAS